MPRVQKILAKGEPHGEIADTLLLKFADRRRQQGFVFGGKGTCVEFDFPSAPHLRTDDLLVLDDGRVAEVVADSEPLVEVREKDFAKATRLVWLLGNRHIPVQVLPNRIRLLATAEIEKLLAERGFASVKLTAPFEPLDDGADRHHDHPHHGHEHHHGHAHHDHGYHDHEHHDHAHDYHHDDHHHHHDDGHTHHHDHRK